eukprot:CAMPEP_0176456568 /NCGR_PEP_ID=MMETSP0127-20121128/31366_1 /TAXON_ID=938130 /ORGANISM="Platyophrya macrostoma, Strain WH" /LENGTH=208 /DNA_ID=CAMNT_0017846553 /DNA_START=74 /DNA_END=700 /DNA_ORIENTATION=-
MGISNFVCPSKLSESDAKFNIEQLSGSKNEELVLLTTKDYREHVGQDVIDLQPDDLYLVMRRDVAIEYIKSPEFYSTIPASCLSICPSVITEFSKLLGIIALPLHDVDAFWVYLIILPDESALIEEEELWLQKKSSLEDFIMSSDLVIEIIKVVNTDDGIKSTDLTRWKIISPHSTALYNAASNQEELEKWVCDFVKSGAGASAYIKI